MLRWLQRALLGAVVIIVVAVAAGLIWEQRSRREVAREFPPPGRMVEFDGKRSHLSCAGSGSPTVVLEGGLGVAGSLTWSDVQPEVAEHTRVCSYDRAGFLWSEPREEPRDADRITGELDALLDAAGESPPYVMVGHSIGGLLVRVYADRFPGEVAGVVLVDAAHPGQYDRYPDAVLDHLSEAEPSLPPRPLFRAWATIGGYRLLMPDPEDPIVAHLPRTVPWGFLGERAARDAIHERAAAAGTLGDRPLVVLTAGAPTRYPGLSDEELEALYETWTTLQAELVELSTRSVQRTVEGATHDIHREDPDAVVEAVRDVVDAVGGAAAPL